MHLLAKIAENEGVKMIIVHGRTRNQIQRKWIGVLVKKWEKSQKIPVVVNGDVNEINDYYESNTNSSDVM